MENTDLGTKGTPLKVVELGIANRIYEEMKKPTFNVAGITRVLNSEGVKITAQSIRKFIAKTRTAQQKLIKRDLAAAESVKQLTMDYSKTLKDILTEVESVKNTAMAKNDMQTYNQLVGKLYQGIELLAKLTGDMKADTSVDIKIIYNEITNNIDKMSKDINITDKDNTIIDIDAEIEEEDREMEKKLKGETEHEYK